MSPADPRPERRHVTARIELDVAGEADLVLAIAIADLGASAPGDESLTVVRDGVPLAPEEVAAPHGGRLHQLRGVEPGHVSIDYAATVTGVARPAPVGPEEWFRYIRPSRYCESDRLGPLARSEFEGLSGTDLLNAISSWVGSHVAYVPGSSRAIDGAVSTLLSRSGVCRDFAHLTVALLRANGIPARVVAVYAPGLEPMDFHAVVEACVDGAWYVVDPTCLAPRRAMVRIATGADAADTAFLTTVRGAVELTDLEVTAVSEPSLPDDDLTQLVQLR